MAEVSLGDKPMSRFRAIQPGRLGETPRCRRAIRVSSHERVPLSRHFGLSPFTSIGGGSAFMLREEISRLVTVGERHRRLCARLLLALVMTGLVFIAGTLLIWNFETGQHGSQIHGLGDAAFFTADQLLTVSSSIPNPVTSVGKIIDVLLEGWAIFVVTAVAGSFATFFSSGDST